MSTEAKFTPGPWSYRNRGTRGGFVRADNSPDVPLADIHFTGFDVGKANAHLIAAAPDLYEALAEMIDFNGSHDEMLALDARARAALASARGEVA